MTVFYLFAEPETLYDCIAFMSHVQFVMGASNLMQYDGRHLITIWGRLYSLGASAIMFSMFAYHVYGKLSTAEQRQLLAAQVDNVLVAIGIVELVMISFMYAITIISLQLHPHRHRAIYQRLHRLDERLRHDFGARLNYRKLLQKNIVVVVTLCAIFTMAVFLVLAYLTSKMYNGEYLWLLFTAGCYIVISFALHCNGYAHLNLVEMLTIRFRLLQQLLRREREQWSRAAGCPKRREQRLLALIAMVQETHQLIEDVNKVFRGAILSGLAHDFTLTTSEAYLIFGGNFSTDSRVIGLLVVCMLAPFYKMMVAPIYCDLSVTEGKKCLELIERMGVYSAKDSRLATAIVCQKYWQIANDFRFRYGLNITINRTIVTTITSVIVNYMLILVQFRMTEEMGHQLTEHRITVTDWRGVVSVVVVVGDAGNATAQFQLPTS